MQVGHAWSRQQERERGSPVQRSDMGDQTAAAVTPQGRAGWVILKQQMNWRTHWHVLGDHDCQHLLSCSQNTVSKAHLAQLPAALV